MKDHNIQTRLKEILLKGIGWIETIISIILVITTVVMTIGLILSLINEGPGMLSENVSVRSILERFFELVICIEFVRMLSKHSVESIIEIILFSIARGMIAEVQSPIETLILIAALLGLMVIRKYFILPDDLEINVKKKIKKEKQCTEDTELSEEHRRN